MPEVVSLLGRRDSPTDALEDYSTLLGAALSRRGHPVRLVRVPWVQQGWPRAMEWLRQESIAWRGEWVLVQYTALGWSRRGFPSSFPAVLRLLRRHDARVAVVFHDAQGFHGQRPVDWLRRAWQHHIMRIAYYLAACSVLTVPLDLVPWLPPRPQKAVFVPVGANVPPANGMDRSVRGKSDGQKTIAVFGVTGGNHIPQEAGDIASIIQRVAHDVPNLRLVVMGRGAEDAQETLHDVLADTNIPVSVLGLLPAEDISRILTSAHALLFVRGHISTRRGSAIAGIACGLPIVAYAGPETDFPITEAGVMLAPQDDREALADALTQVLTDRALWQMLHERSLAAQRDYFSWEAIAERFMQVLADV